MMFPYLVPFLWGFVLSPYAGLAYTTLDAVFANLPNQVCLGDGMGRFTCVVRCVKFRENLS